MQSKKNAKKQELYPIFVPSTILVESRPLLHHLLLKRKKKC